MVEPTTPRKSPRRQKETRSRKTTAMGNAEIGEPARTDVKFQRASEKKAVAGQETLLSSTVPCALLSLIAKTQFPKSSNQGQSFIPFSDSSRHGMPRRWTVEVPKSWGTVFAEAAHGCHSLNRRSGLVRVVRRFSLRALLRGAETRASG